MTNFLPAGSFGHGTNIPRYSDVDYFMVQDVDHWLRHCDLPIKSFQLEHLAVEFLRDWPYSRDLFWIDWMIRDFFAHHLSRENGFLTMPGTFALVALRNDRIAKARTAHAAADRAFYLERDNQDGMAGPEWQSLFGTMIPMFVA